MASFQTIDFNSKRVLIRVDFNVPLSETNQVVDDSRITATLPTIKAILKAGGKIVLMSHLGRPEGEKKLKYSLFPVAKHLSTLLGMEVVLAEDCIGEEVLKLSKKLRQDQILMLENLRFYKEETEGNEAFAKKLAEMGDIYVNDAFGAAHRAHASTAIIAHFYSTQNRCFGLLMGEEVSSLKKALSNGEKPITAVIGGAKVSSKIDVLSNLLSKVDNIIIGGGMAFTFIKAKGGHVGASLVEEDKITVALNLIKEAELKGVNLYLPIDSVNAFGFKDEKPSSITPIDQIPDNEMGLDIGMKSIKLLGEVLLNSKTIIWNGPVGVFEFKNYENGTKQIGEFIVEATQNGAFSLVGGGDSVAAAKQFGIDKKLSYVSTGGGAMLEYLEGKELPGIKAIED